MEFRFLRDVVCAIQRKVLNAVHSYSETSGSPSQAATAPARTLHNVTPTVFLTDIYTVNCRWLKGRIKYVLGTRPIEETTMPTIAFVVFDGFYSMALAAQSVFEFTNVEVGEPFYEMLNVSERGGPVRASSGLTVLTEVIDDRVFDTVIFPGSDPSTAKPPPAVLAYVRRSAETARRTASICTGAFVLAEAGLLDGRRATTHWYYAHDLRTRFPSVTVDDDRIFISDGADLDFGGHDGGHRPRARAGRKRSWCRGGARGCPKPCGLSSARRRPVATLCAARTRAEVGSNSVCADVCKEESQYAALGRAIGGGRAIEPTSVQPGVSCGDRADASKSHRATAA
jgi:putative intracellular protease/amidase